MLIMRENVLCSGEIYIKTNITSEEDHHHYRHVFYLQSFSPWSPLSISLGCSWGTSLLPWNPVFLWNQLLDNLGMMAGHMTKDISFKLSFEGELFINIVACSQEKAILKDDG